MDSVDYLRFVASLALVLGLLLGAAYALRRWGHRIPGLALPGATRTDRLAVIASLPVDARRRLVLVRRDDVEHLLLLEPAGTTVIETGIRAKEN